jgi:hypothetical protein
MHRDYTPEELVRAYESAYTEEQLAKNDKYQLLKALAESERYQNIRLGNFANCPDDTYVADPNVGYSNHSRGFAVDLTLVDGDGNELLMPTGFDDFSLGADRDYSDCDSQAAGNARYLEAVMEKHGFSGYWGEWWHYNDTRKYDVEDSFDPAVIARCAVNRNVILLERFWDPTTVILEIPEGECVTRLGYREEYILAEYWGYRGYLPTDALVQD